MSYVPVSYSDEARRFFEAHGIEISAVDSAHNVLVLVNPNTGTTLTLWAESDAGTAAGIPGIYVDVDD